MWSVLTLVFCAVYPALTTDCNEILGPLHIETSTGTVPQKYYPLHADDKQAIRKAGAFVSFIKAVPQINPLQLSSLGPYNIALPDVDFKGDILLKNITVHGLKSLSLAGLELRMRPDTARLDFNASIPEVSADVNFELQAVLSNQPLNVDGQVSVALSNLVISAAIGNKAVLLAQYEVYQVDSADIEIDLGQIQVSMDMNQYSEDFRDIAVQFLQNTDQYSSIVDDLLRAVLKAVNKELTLVDRREILYYLLKSDIHKPERATNSPTNIYH